MKVINLNDDIEDLFLSKSIIESYWIEQEIITQKYSLDDFIVTAFTRGSGLLSGAGNIETLSTLVQAKIKKGPIPPEMRPLTTIIFIIVVLVVLFISLNRNKGISSKVKNRRKLRERAE